MRKGCGFQFFIWNLPLFIKNSRMIEILKERFGGEVHVDLFAPRKSIHRFHAGCARIVSGRDLKLGNVDIGCRFPAFMKRFKRRKVLHRIKSVPLTTDLMDETSDMKSNSTDGDLPIY